MNSSPQQGTQSVRVRFAPSPTGFLHIGGVRTALFNWLYAKRHGGKFLLRIEDTDLDRSEQQFTDDIFASMRWLGLNWDEEPIFQSKRLDVYRRKAEELIEAGLAYRCTCTAEEVDAMREAAMKKGQKPQYDRSCREKNHPHGDQPYVIRAKLPLDGGIEFDDLVRGRIRFENTELDDFVIVRSNGAPTYNLSVVVDDVESQITHLIRGEDHINNTPKQLHLYRFFGFDQPLFAHLPMILGSDKKKLSKRHGAVSANVYRAEGYLPETLLNFLARLGWSHGDQEVFSVEELVEFFSFNHVQKSGAVFNSEKLLWLNGEHIRRTTSDRLARIVIDDFDTHFKGESQIERVNTPMGHRICGFIQPKVKTILEMVEQLVPLCTALPVEVDSSGLKWNKKPELKEPLKAAIHRIHGNFGQKISEFQKGASAFSRAESENAPWGNIPSLEDAGMNSEAIEAALRQAGEEHGVKLGDLAQPMRLCVTGRMVSAGLFELLAVLPWDVVEPRLAKVQTL